jgi:hypothetical protein
LASSEQIGEVNRLVEYRTIVPRFLFRIEQADGD